MVGTHLTENHIKKILTDEKLFGIKSVLEKDHAIDCIFLLKLNKGRWKNAKAFMRGLNLTLSDGTFRSRMIEMEHLGLAKSIPIDPLKKYYVISDLGDRLADLLLKLFDGLE